MEIHFGLLSPTITQQLFQQNLTVEDSEKFDRCVDSINTLWAEYFLTDKERDRVFKRIFKQIEKEVECKKC